MNSNRTIPSGISLTRSLPGKREHFDLDVVALGYYAFLFWAIFLYLDPFYTGFGAFRVTRDIGPLKYISLIIGLLAGIFAFVAVSLRGSRLPAEMTRALKAGIPLFCFAGLVLLGSAYSRFSSGLQESFLSVGLSIAGFPLAILFFHGCLQGARVINVFLGVLLASCVYIVPMIVMKHLQGGQAFHTEIFLVIPLCVYYFLKLRSRTLGWGVLLLMVATAFVLQKNLGYLMLGGSLVYLTAIHFKRFPYRVSSIGSFMVATLMVLFALVLAAALAFLLIKREEYLPSGNVEVRVEVYTYAINQFLASPTWGDLFSGSSLVYLKGREVLGNTHVTTHSDWLDVLSHGGMLGTALYVLAHAIPLKRAMAILRKADLSTDVNTLHGLLAISLGGIVVGMFVSLFTSPPVATLYWFNLGLISALTARIESSLCSVANPGQSSTKRGNGPRSAASFRSSNYR